MPKRVPDDEVDAGLRVSRKWAAKQDPAVLREKNRLSKQKNRALQKAGLDAAYVLQRVADGLYTTFRHVPRAYHSLSTPSTSQMTSPESAFISYGYPHPLTLTIDPIPMESSPICDPLCQAAELVSVEPVGCCDTSSIQSTNHSLTEPGMPEDIRDGDSGTRHSLPRLSNTTTSTTVRTVFDPAYIYDPSFVTGDAIYCEPIPVLCRNKDISICGSREVSELRDITSVGEKTDHMDLVTDYARFFKDPDVIQMKDSTRMCTPTLKRNGRNLVKNDADAVRDLARYDIVTTSTSRVSVITQFSSNEELAAKIRSKLSNGRYIYIPGSSMDSLRKDGRKLDMNYLQEFGIWDQSSAVYSRPRYTAKPSTSLRTDVSATLYNHHLGLTAFRFIDASTMANNVSGVLKQSYPCPTHIHSGQLGHRSWALLHHAGILTEAHHDAEGHSTAIVGHKGVKFWSIITLKPQYQSLPRTELLDKLADINQPNKQGISNYIQLCDIEIVKLLPGDVLLQPPGSFHRVYTPIPSFATGAAFFVYEALHWTEISRQVDAWDHRYVTNIEHDDPSGYQTLLHMLLAMQAMKSRRESLLDAWLSCTVF
ncbi:hypothetical protein IW261DRAFT_1573276 [Armillaria novae-zelandiae]|uniref:JmjC domain-containing protein n=1 Tax=Armillaria novae-zelandiae TaxID=153914 RepID=A0AA39NNL4_9AGAR|nr:hypothetical protein IW261DRAFT_1573276 [Armillaria novae-zelandiae]